MELERILVPVQDNVHSVKLERISVVTLEPHLQCVNRVQLESILLPVHLHVHSVELERILVLPVHLHVHSVELERILLP